MLPFKLMTLTEPAPAPSGNETGLWKPSRYSFAFDLHDWEDSLLLFNSFTQAISRFPGHPLQGLLRKVLKGHESPKRLPPPLQQVLAQEGFLVPSDSDELQLLREKVHAKRFRGSSFGLIIAPTLECNFRCSYCFEHHRRARMDSQAVASLKDFVVHQVIPQTSRVHIFWFGGEPLLVPGLILDLQAFIQKRCQENGVKYQSVLVTNGYLLDRRVAAKLAGSGTHIAWITLDGPPEVHDRRRVLAGGSPTFARIYANLKDCVDIFRWINLRINLDRDNWGSFAALVDLLEKDGLLSRVVVSPVFIRARQDINQHYLPHCFGNRDFQKLLLAAGELLITKKLPFQAIFELIGLPECGAIGAARLVIGPRGLVYKCPEDLGKPARAVGVLQEGKLLYNEKIHRWLDFDPTAPEECQKCRYLPLCLSKTCFYETITYPQRRWQCLGAGIKENLEAFVKLDYQRRVDTGG
jgi:uncharacterized protein